MYYWRRRLCLGIRSCVKEHKLKISKIPQSLPTFPRASFDLGEFFLPNDKRSNEKVENVP